MPPWCGVESGEPRVECRDSAPSLMPVAALHTCEAGWISPGDALRCKTSPGLPTARARGGDSSARADGAHPARQVQSTSSTLEAAVALTLSVSLVAPAHEFKGAGDQRGSERRRGAHRLMFRLHLRMLPCKVHALSTEHGSGMLQYVCLHTYMPAHIDEVVHACLPSTASRLSQLLPKPQALLVFSPSNRGLLESFGPGPEGA